MSLGRFNFVFCMIVGLVIIVPCSNHIYAEAASSMELAGGASYSVGTEAQEGDLILLWITASENGGYLEITLESPERTTSLISYELWFYGVGTTTITKIADSSGYWRITFESQWEDLDQEFTYEIQVLDIGEQLGLHNDKIKENRKAISAVGAEMGDINDTVVSNQGAIKAVESDLSTNLIMTLVALLLAVVGLIAGIAGTVMMNNGLKRTKSSIESQMKERTDKLTERYDQVVNRTLGPPHHTFNHPPQPQFQPTPLPQPSPQQPLAPPRL